MKKLLISLLIFIPIYSFACSCSIPTLEKKYANADFVADITILKVYKNKKNEERYKADIQINTLYKGPKIESIYIYGRSDNKMGTSCDIFIPKGSRLIAYSKNNENIFSIGMCSGLIYIKHTSKYWKERVKSKNYKETLKKEINYIETQAKANNLNSSSLQDKKDYSKKVTTIDSTIATLYSVISGNKGEARNWELFKHLFHKDAKLIPTGKTKDQKTVARYMSPEDYINTSGKWLVENGFHEVEINRKTQTFGNITHVFSTYNSFKRKDDRKPFIRGINSIQLLNDGKRWWIINIYWMQESDEFPIPEEYLPKG